MSAETRDDRASLRLTREVLKANLEKPLVGFLVDLQPMKRSGFFANLFSPVPSRRTFRFQFPEIRLHLWYQRVADAAREDDYADRIVRGEAERARLRADLDFASAKRRAELRAHFRSVFWRANGTSERIRKGLAMAMEETSRFLARRQLRRLRRVA